MRFKYGGVFRGISFSFLTLIYKVLLEISYTLYIGHNIYWYYNIVGENLYSYIIFMIIIEIIGNFIYLNVKKENRSFRSIVMYLLYFLAFIPALSYFNFEFLDKNYQLAYLAFWGNFYIFYAILAKSTHSNDELKNRKTNINKPFVIVIIITSIYLGYKFQTLNILKIEIADLNDLYRLRKIMKNAELGQIISIFRLWASNIVLPFLFLRSLNHKKYYFSIFYFYLMLVLFSIGGEKTILAIILLGITLSYLANVILQAVPLLLISLTLASIVEYYTIGSKIIASLTTYRTCYLPVQIGYYYYDFMKDKQKLWFLEGALGSRINNYLFNRSIEFYPTLSYEIGYRYFGSGDMNANTGLFGSAYAEMGPVGIFIGPLILIICLIITDRIYKRYNIKYSVIIAIYFVSYIINGPNSGTILAILVPSFLMVADYKFEASGFRDKRPILSMLTEQK